MPTTRRFLSRRWLHGFLGVLALLFGLAMLHPYPRQSLFGPTIRGEPWCVWEMAVRRHLNRAEYEKTLWAKSMRWAGIKNLEMDVIELLDHEEMVPLLLQLTEDPDPVIRQGAVSTFFWHKNLQDPSALPILRARFNDTDVRCRIDATMAVATIEPRERVYPILLQILDDPTSQHRFEAMRALTYLANADDAAFAAMIRHAKDPDPLIRAEIMFSLVSHGKKGVPTLLNGLQDPHMSVCRDALESLEKIGPDAKDAIPALERFLSNKDPSARRLAVDALIAIEPARFEDLKEKKE
jgi:HEAT repeat protein